jgi:sulfate adenylyltransferase subunit 1 (EFTu-like GTPase family)
MFEQAKKYWKADLTDVSDEESEYLFNGKIKVGDKIKMLSTGAVYDVVEVGVNTPNPKKLSELCSGEVGYITGSIKSISDVKVGDLLDADNEIGEVLSVTVKEITDEYVVIDANHLLAGKDLVFDIEILDIN